MSNDAFYGQQPWERPADPPSDWIELPAPAGFNFTFGKVFAHRGPQGISVGFRCTERHVNTSGFCHGGALAAFSDMQPYGIQHMVGYAHAVVPTITMNIDFVSVVRLGDWVVGELEVTRETRGLVFGLMRCRVGDQPVMNARGIFKKMEIEAVGDPSYFRNVGPEIERRFAAIGA